MRHLLIFPDKKRSIFLSKIGLIGRLGTEPLQPKGIRKKEVFAFEFKGKYGENTTSASCIISAIL